MKKYNCQIDLKPENDWLILRPDNLYNSIHIPINHTLENNLTILPAISEVVRKIDINSATRYILIPNQDIQNGVFIGNSIADSKNTFVRILYTTDKTAIIQLNTLKVEPLDDYDIIKSNKNVSKEEILDKLNKNFPPQFKEILNEICTKYTDIFGKESESISTNNFYKQKIRMKDDEPVYIKNYRFPHSPKDEVEKQVDKLTKDKIVEPSVSKYNCPLLIVPKKSLSNCDTKRWRLVIDYRQIKKKLSDKFPLPRIDDILDQLGRAKYFSCLDLMSGFHQIELEETSRNITFFSTSNGSYRFTRLPFGLKIAPNFFQRMMTIAFSGIEPSQSFLYMDDLIVICCSEKHMIKKPTNVFDLCRKHNLKLHPEKCTFFRHEVTFQTVRNTM